MTLLLRNVNALYCRTRDSLFLVLGCSQKESIYEEEYLITSLFHFTSFHFTHVGGSVHRCGWRPLAFLSPSFGLRNFHPEESTPSSLSARSAKSFRSRMISKAVVLSVLLLLSALLLLSSLLFLVDDEFEGILYFKLLATRFAFNMFTQHTRRQTNMERPFGGGLDFELFL